MTPDKVQIQDLITIRDRGSLSLRARTRDFTIDPETGCWVWQKKSQLKGYGRSSFMGRAMYAYRAYYEAVYGPVPDGLVLDHLCRNRACVNPEHLEAVTQAQNVQRGSLSKLSMEIAREVRQRTREGQSAGQIKAEMGVSIQNVWWINEDIAWREDVNAARSPTRPDRVCLECGGEIPLTKTRRARFCCEVHQKRWASRRQSRRSAGIDPDAPGDLRRRKAA